jgi:carbamoyl-phosphate synthase large subunit
MPKRTDLSSILIIGSGPIVIGQACEFDYSGVQACKALREEGYKVILVNSNPATIMTDPEIADIIYIEPIIPEIIEIIIKQHLPSGLLPTMGGQIALNTALELEERGILAQYNVELIGAKAPNIKKAEDRSQFREAMRHIGLDVPKSFIISSIEESWDCLEELKFPMVVRSSFTLAGSGGNIIYKKEDFENSILQALDASPIKQALLEEYLFGWKEFELEMMQDKAGNCIVVCAIENINPMGVHTGDSITVAPTLTLTDKEFQRMRNMAIAIMREIGIDTGGANVQFAVNPKDGRIVVIEMNPRVSRSSALASKATGFPIAKISAKLAVGFTLDEIPNEITKTTFAAFEPTIDYIVTKIPRFSFEKFPGVSSYLSTSMKSVGEAMAIGRTFIESFQKAISSLEDGLSGFDEISYLPKDIKERLKIIKDHLIKPIPNQFLYIAEAFRAGLTTEEVHDLCQYDPWFLNQIKRVVEIENDIKKKGLPVASQMIKYLKSFGFSNKRLSKLTSLSEDEINQQLINHKIFPSYKRVDTCAAEFPSSTPYLYSTYEAHFSEIDNCEAEISNKQKVIIIGSGPNRVSQGIEFDYCCVQASLALKKDGYETIMINCNPETVSTDYTVSDRLYFEPITEEYVLAIIQKEKSKGNLKGVILQLGGQTPLNLIKALSNANVPILGTTLHSIELAENRCKFSKLLTKLKLKQPKNAAANCKEKISELSNKIGYPLIIRPSYVIGGHKMEVITSEENIVNFLNKVDQSFFISGPLLIESFLENATEVDVDAISDGNNTYIIGILEHFEKAGIHSGDSTSTLPSFSLSKNVLKTLEEYTFLLCKELHIQGVINIQFAIKDEEVFILEVNPRASRTMPFISKARGIAFIQFATQLMLGKRLNEIKIPTHISTEYVFVKQPIFSFEKLPNVDPSLNCTMMSTGEVMGIGHDLEEATAKALLSILRTCPSSKTVFIKINKNEELKIIPIINKLITLGFKIKIDSKNEKILRNMNAARSFIETINYYENDIFNENLLFKDVFLIINTTNEKKNKSSRVNFKKFILKNHIIECTNFHHIKGIIRALQFYILKDLKVIPIFSHDGYLKDNFSYDI